MKKVLKVLGFILYLVVGAIVFIAVPYGIGSIMHYKDGLALTWGMGIVMLFAGIMGIFILCAFGFFAWRHYTETFWKEDNEDKE